MWRRAPFRHLVEQILAECAAHGIDLPRVAVEDMVADRVRDMAAVLRVREDTIVRSYLSTLDPAAFVAALQAASEHGARELANTPPTILGLDSGTGLLQPAPLGVAAAAPLEDHARIRHRRPPP